MSNPSSRKNSKGDMPFYVPPSGVTTSSQIIKETKEKLNDITTTKKIIPKPITTTINTGGTITATNPNSIRTLQTNRPFTPRDTSKRSLFGKNSVRALNERPPSTYSVSSKNFESIDQSRPPSGTRLSPIEKKFPTSKSTNDSPKSQIIDSIEIEMSSKSSSATTHQIGSASPLLNLKNLSNSKTRLLPQLSHSIQRTNSFDNDTDSNQTSLNGFKSESMILNATANPDDLNRKIDDDKLKQTKTTKTKIEEEAYWANVLTPHLNDMSLVYQDKSTDRFCELCGDLYELLKAKNMLGRSCSKRTNILKIIFKFLDTDNDAIKLKLARIILALEVSSNNLTSICRLLFSLSRKEENDGLFSDDNLIHLILDSAERLDFKANSDSVVYFCGTLKNLSADNKLLKELSTHDVIKILSNIMKNISQFYKENETKKSEAGHVLVQLTSTLRNLADLSHNREKFINCQIIEELTNALKYYTGDSDLTLNISRIFSKLTLHVDCCTILNECTSCYKSFIKVMIKHELKQDLIVRVGFILGNLFSRNDVARVRYVSEKHSIDTLLSLLRVYLDLNQKTGKSKDENDVNETEDVIIKIIRVLANLTINDKIGLDIASREDCLDILLKILETKDLKSEELVINTIVTLNNLTFYDTALFNEKKSLDLINVLMKYLLSNNYDAILEVFRVIANLSRHKAIRNYLVSRKIDVMTITLLDSGNHELVYIVIGVLINLMSDEDKRSILKKEDGILKLIEVLSDFSYIDWQLASMVCKVLMNYSEKIYSSDDCFGVKQVHMLRNILYEFLDEKIVVELMKSKQMESSEELNAHDEYMLSIWQEEFCPVAQRLLERIESHQSQLEPI